MPGPAKGEGLRRRPLVGRRTMHRYRDRRHPFLWGWSPARRLRALLTGLLAAALIAFIVILIARRPPAPPAVPKPTPEPAPQVATPTPMPSPTLVPLPTPDATSTPGPTPTPLVIPGADVSSGRPSLSVASRGDLTALLRWMIDSGTDSVSLSRLALSREVIADVAGKFSSYFDTFSLGSGDSRITVTFKPGVRILQAIRAGETDALDETDRGVAAQAQAAVDRLVEPGMTDWEKELAIHDYVAGRCEYPSAIDGENVQNVRGFFEDGLCRCAGYVDTFRLLAQLAGLEVETIGGPTTRDAAGEKGHAWNLIRLDGLWYAVDVTWDDMLGGASEVEHAFFNLPYSAFGGSRSSDASCAPPGSYAAAVDGKYYYYRPACAARTVDEALALAARQLDAGRRAWICFLGEDLSAPLQAALESRYQTTVRSTELSEDLKIAVYRYSLR